MMEDIVNSVVFAILSHPFTWIFIGLTVALYGIQSLIGRQPNTQSAPTTMWDFFGLAKMNAGLRAVLGLLWLILFAVFFAGVAWTLFAIAKSAVTASDTDFRRYLLTLAAMTAGLSALVALPFTLIRTKNLEANTDATQKGLVTDRLNKAVEGLGAQKEVNRLGRNISYTVDDMRGTNFELDNAPHPIPSDAREVEYGEWKHIALTEPNLEVRIGSIYALERIAKENKDYHVQVMEILCAYVRENAPASSAVEWPELAMRKGENEGPLEEDFASGYNAFLRACYDVKARTKPRNDIQTTLTVLGRRSTQQRKWELEWRAGEETFIIDLKSTNLQCAQLAKLSFDKADLSLSRLEGSNLADADFSKTQLSNASLTSAFMDGANFFGAQLPNADLQGVDFANGDLRHTNCTNARLQGSYFRYTRFNDAKLNGCFFQWCDLNRAAMPQTDLSRAKLQSTDLTATNLRNAHIAGSNLHGADIYLTDFQSALFSDARLEGVEHSDMANFEGAAFKETDIQPLEQMRTPLSNCFGDGSVVLPSNWKKPDFWPDFSLDPIHFDEEWEKWQDAPDSYDPPRFEDCDYDEA